METIIGLGCMPKQHLLVVVMLYRPTPQRKELTPRKKLANCTVSKAAKPAHRITKLTVEAGATL